MRVVALVPVDQPSPAPTVHALTLVRGEPLLAHAVRALVESGCVDLLVVTTPTAKLGRCRGALDPFARAGTSPQLLPCDGDRPSALGTALNAVEPASYDVVLVHDPSHAFTPASTIGSVVEMVASGAAAALPVLPVTDTVKLVDEDHLVTGTHDRAALRATQAPIGFAEPIVRAACPLGTSDTDLLHTLGSRVGTVAGHPHGAKLATEFDLAVAEGGFADIADLSEAAEPDAASAGTQTSAEPDAASAGTQTSVGTDNREDR